MKKIILAIVMGIFLFIPGNIKAEKATVNLYLFLADGILIILNSPLIN